MSDQVVKQALVKLDALMPQWKMPVIIGNALAMIFHEACGHLLGLRRFRKELGFGTRWEPKSPILP